MKGIGHFQDLWFFGNFLWKFFGRNFFSSLGIFNDCLHFYMLADFSFSKSQLITRSYLNFQEIYLFIKISIFVKILSQSRKEDKFRSLEVREARSLHLKIGAFSYLLSCNKSWSNTNFMFFLFCSYYCTLHGQKYFA